MLKFVEDIYLLKTYIMREYNIELFSFESVTGDSHHNGLERY